MLRLLLIGFALLIATAARAAAPADDKRCPDQPEMSFTAWTSTLGQQFGAGTREFIFADGYVCTDTDAKFAQFLKDNPPKAPNTIVVLNSGGGDVEAGLKMGRLIRQQKMWTQVGSRFPLMIGGNENIPDQIVPFIARPVSPPFPGYCYSSCTLIMLGGAYRFVDYGSNYGVHRFHYDNPVTNLADQAQIDSAEIVQYVAEMGVSADFMTEMVKKGGNDVTNLTPQRLAQLQITTPRWHTSWDITPVADNSGFFLQGKITDPWGAHEIAVTCYPKGNRIPSQPAQAQAQPQSGQTKDPPLLLMSFALDPGARAKAQDVVGAVQEYVFETDDDWEPVPDSDVAQRATVMGPANRLTAAVEFGQSALNYLSNVKHVGFAFMLDPAAKLPVRLLQFQGDLDGAKLKSYAATCH